MELREESGRLEPAEQQQDYDDDEDQSEDSRRAVAPAAAVAPARQRADEELNWCQGMTATTPDEALACARAILRPKASDEYQWETVVGFSGARDVLRRLVGGGPAPFPEVSD